MPSPSQPTARHRLLAVLAGVVLALFAKPVLSQQAAAAQPPSTGASGLRASVGPAWSELTPAQREALAPLAGTWPQLSEGQKRKWIALAPSYVRLPPPEQAKLHSRMREWAAMSPQQRAQARLNFGETQQLPADEKRAKWEAYQALPAEEKRKLAADAAPKQPPATAAAIKPVPPQKLTNVPKAAVDEPKPPRIAPPSPPEPAASSQ